MKNLQIFEQREVLGKKFRIYGDVENPLFLAKDVAEWIGHNKPSEMIINVDEDEKLKAIVSHSGQSREMWFLTEDGLYEVLMQSRKPIAKQFKKQVKMILKSLRKGDVKLIKHNELDTAILSIFHEDDGIKRLEAAKTIERISYKKGHEDGYEEGKRESYSKAEQEVLAKIMNGNNKDRNLTQIAIELTDAWSSELDGRVITSSDITRWMEYKGFIVKVRFEQIKNGKILLDKNGDVVYQKRLSCQPTDKFEKWISGRGYVTTGTTNDGRKKTINYKSDFVERMIQVESNKISFLDFIINKDKGNLF